MTHAAAIFDLDGTLIDSIRDIGEAMNRTLAAMGHPVHELAKYSYFVGDGVRQLVTRALPERNRSDREIDACLASYRMDYGRHWNVNTRPYEGIPELLATLVRKGIPLGVLSNKPDGVTRQCVEHFFPDIPFIAVSGQREDIPRKPDPTAALLIAESLNCPPAECVFVGDTATDMDTAVSAGMFPVGVTWGFRTAEELTGHGARMLAYEPAAVAGLFGRIES